MQRGHAAAVEHHDDDGPPVVDLYHRDFHAWALEQAQALQRAGESRGAPEALRGAIADLDLENLAEEITGLAKSEQRELRKRLTTIVEHLLKVQHSPAPRPRVGWRGTVQRTRREVRRLLEDSPSLEKELQSLLDEAKEDAVEPVSADLEDRAEGEAGKLAGAMRKALRHYTREQVLDPDWWPPLGREDTAPAAKAARRKPPPEAPPKHPASKSGRGDTKRGRT